MAKYCTLDDIKALVAEDKLIKLTDDEKKGIVNTTVVDAIIGNASAVIDSYLQERYVLPLASTPPVITAYCVAISIYRIFYRREKVPEPVAAEYENTIEKLEKMATGDISLGIPGISELFQIKKNKTVADRVFSNPGGYFL